jgi:hypothetical protein
MEPFEYSGLWWVPDNPAERVAGVLNFSPKDGLVLNLLGALGERRGGVGTKSYDIILGLVYDARLGQSVTLKGCRHVRYTETLSGLSAEGYRANRAFFGRHLKDPEDYFFCQCDLETSGLSAWAAHLTGLEYGGESAADVRLRYTLPEPLAAEIPGGAIRLILGATVTGTPRERCIKEKVRLNIAVTEPIAEQEWINRFVFPLLNFVTLATDVPNALIGWEFTGSEGPYSWVKVVPNRVYTEAVKDEAVPPNRTLIPLERETFPPMIVPWLEVHEKHRDSCNVFFSLRYAPGRYNDLRFLGISQALVLYQAKRQGVGLPGSLEPPSDLLSLLPPKAQEEFRRWAKTVVVDNFRSTLTHLAYEHQRTLLPLAHNNLEKFVDDIMRFRDYVLYRISPRPEPYSIGLYLAAERLSCLMKSCFLAELGFTPEERAARFQQTDTYLFLLDQQV